MSKVHVKTGDTVVILSGKDRGKKGKIMAVSPKEGKVIVENANIVSKHVKPRKMGEAGGIIKAESAIYASPPLGGEGWPIRRVIASTQTRRLK